MVKNIVYIIWKALKRYIKRAAEKGLANAEETTAKGRYDDECRLATAENNNIWYNIEPKVMLRYKDRRRTEVHTLREKKQSQEWDSVAEMEALFCQNEMRTFYSMLKNILKCYQTSYQLFLLAVGKYSFQHLK